MSMEKKPFIANWEKRLNHRNELSSISTRTVNDHDPDDLELSFVVTILTEVSGEGDPDELC